MRYYFGVLIPVFIEEVEKRTGRRYSKETVHRFFKSLFGIDHVSSLSDNKFLEYRKNVALFITETLGVVVPLANEPWYNRLTEMSMYDFLKMTLYGIKGESISEIIKAREGEAVKEVAAG